MSPPLDHDIKGLGVSLLLVLRAHLVCMLSSGVFMSDLVHVTSRSLAIGKVDFEGLRIRASIVKKTLRMIELAEEYDFQPEPGLGERCLWITAFDENMLHRIAGGLE